VFVEAVSPSEAEAACDEVTMTAVRRFVTPIRIDW
jgi:hypothetical protein